MNNNKNVALMLVVSALITTGCGPSAQFVAKCGDAKAQKDMMIHLNQSDQKKLEARPWDICVEPGTRITIKLVGGNPELGDVGVFPKDADNFWMYGSNFDARKRIHFFVPREITPDKSYDFNVKWKDKDLLDPRVTIRTDGR